MVGRRSVNARRGVRAALLSALTLSVVAVGAPPAFAASIESEGPLTRVEISPDLNCAVDHAGDTSPEFFGDTACGTLLASGGTLFGPANIPAGGGASPRTAFIPVSQSPVTGTGTAADPYAVVTVVSLGTSGLQITETDSYVTGEESYRTDVTVLNLNDVPTTAILYRAGDCFLQNSDFGFGSADPATGSVSCVAGVDDGTGTIVPGTRIEQWFPLSAGSHYLEDFFGNVWAAIGAQTPFTDSCAQCANYIDNGAGLSWDLSVPAGGSATRSHLTVFSPLGNAPLSTAKTADTVSASPGGTNGYTITIHNPNIGPVSLSSITDTLPAGFSYVAGSTTGATTADPAISSQDLSWAGPISVPASGDASIHFNVTVASTPGDYFNNAGGSAEGFTVAPTGDTAMITVTGDVMRILSVTRAGTGTGTVTSSPAGIDCGSTCEASFNDGTPVTLTATPATGSTFTGWSGDCSGSGVCSVTMDANHAVTATFTPSGAQFSATINTAEGGVLLINPQGQDNLGTTGKIKIPPQPGPATDVVVTASLFGLPGESDATCGGNVCIGQGIEWAVSDPTAITQMRVKFMEAPRITHGASAQDAIAYKDGVPVLDCAPKIPQQPREMPCIVWRFTNPHGGWQITFLVDGDDPKGRI